MRSPIWTFMREELTSSHSTFPSSTPNKQLPTPVSSNAHQTNNTIQHDNMSSQ